MFTVNRKKGRKGFTLVEVIVVAVIVAALAAVAIPLYMSYVDSTRKNSAANAAGSAASFCGACVNSGGVPANSAATGVAGGTLTCGGTGGNATTMSIPTDIVITLVTAVTASSSGPAIARGVQAYHFSFPTGISTYSY